MKEHLETLSILGVFTLFLAGLKYFPAITIGAVIFLFAYAMLYVEIKKTNNKIQEQDKLKNGKR